MRDRDRVREQWRKHASEAAGAGIPRRHLLTASVFNAALSALLIKAFDQNSPKTGRDRPSGDENQELTAHRRDYYRRARF